MEIVGFVLLELGSIGESSSVVMTWQFLQIRRPLTPAGAVSSRKKPGAFRHPG
jgi:hypothetical protein